MKARAARGGPGAGRPIVPLGGAKGKLGRAEITKSGIDGSVSFARSSSSRSLRASAATSDA